MLNLSSPLLQGLDKQTFDTDFKVWIMVEEIYFSDIDDMDKLELIDAVVNIDKPTQVKHQIIIDFLKLGTKEIDTNKADNDANTDEENERLYSYVWDWKLIYAAFLEQYGIDLIDTKLHYWKFKALFESLHDTMFNKILEYRSVDTRKIKDREQRAFYEEMQQRYSLPNTDLQKDLEALAAFNKL